MWRCPRHCNSATRSLTFLCAMSTERAKKYVGELRLKGNSRRTLNTFIEPFPKEDLKNNNNKKHHNPTSSVRAVSLAASLQPPAGRRACTGRVIKREAPRPAASSGGVPRARAAAPFRPGLSVHPRPGAAQLVSADPASRPPLTRSRARPGQSGSPAPRLRQPAAPSIRGAAGGGVLW